MTLNRYPALHDEWVTVLLDEPGSVALSVCGEEPGTIYLSPGQAQAIGLALITRAEQARAAKNQED